MGDILLWGDNQRLKIHVAQFKKTHGRDPSSADLVDIMNSRASLPGLDDGDQFKIDDLARSIAANGVRTPPPSSPYMGSCWTATGESRPACRCSPATISHNRRRIGLRSYGCGS